MGDAPKPLGFTMEGYATENAALDTAFRIVDEAKLPKARSGKVLVVCAAPDLAPGDKRIVESDGVSLGVFNVGGQFYAIKNVCPHQGAPLCQGDLHATHRPSDVFEFHPDLAGRVLRCPWHGWEFDIVTGKGLYDRNSRVATYACNVNEDGDVMVQL